MKLEQIAVQTFAYKKVSLEHMAESLHGAGVKNFEFYAAAPHYCHYADFPATAEEIRALDARIHGLCTEYGLTMSCFAPESADYPINIASENPELREKSVRYFLDYLDDLAALGCDQLMLTSGWDYFDRDKMAAWRRSVKSLRRIAARAEELGVRLLLRPVSKFSTNLVHDLPSLTRMLFEVGSDSLYACIDVANLAENGETIADYYDVLPDRIGHFRCYNLTDGGEVTTGEGVPTVKAYFDELDRFGYTGTVGFEMNFEHMVDPDCYVRQAMDQLRGAL